MSIKKTESKLYGKTLSFNKQIKVAVWNETPPLQPGGGCGVLDIMRLSVFMIVQLLHRKLFPLIKTSALSNSANWWGRSIMMLFRKSKCSIFFILLKDGPSMLLISLWETNKWVIFSCWVEKEIFCKLL